MTNFAGGLGISAVAARTGVGEATLRAWERRFGFPKPDRLEGGHRRYSDGEVDRILRVVAERARGRSLAGAIASVDGPVRGEQPSIFAGLRAERPDLQVWRLSRRTMLAISQAIEDEGAAQADRAVLVAAFQREAVYRRIQPRWEDLARTAARAIVFADFPTSRRAPDGPDEVALPATSPLRREWAVICDAPGWMACLTGWERPARPGEKDVSRLFEAVWTVEPEAVRRASHLALGLAALHAPGLGPWDEAGLGDLAPLDASALARRATALTNRIVAYLDPRAETAP
jgi:DICT domain-containing protein/predicted DNA-binding transcriptional regulator AlpA